MKTLAFLVHVFDPRSLRTIDREVALVLSCVQRGAPAEDRTDTFLKPSLSAMFVGSITSCKDLITIQLEAYTHFVHSFCSISPLKKLIALNNNTSVIKSQTQHKLSSMEVSFWSQLRFIHVNFNVALSYVSGPEIYSHTWKLKITLFIKRKFKFLF